MFTSEVKIRVRYAETDRMGYVYYGNYATYFEVARVEAIRSLGFSYKSIEDAGFMLPVAEFSIRYKRPAFYDEELIIRSTLPEMPGSRMRFEHEVLNMKGETITTATVTLVFVNASTGKPCAAPPEIIAAFAKFY